MPCATDATTSETSANGPTDTCLDEVKRANASSGTNEAYRP
jgi:hypothetical protein